MKVTISILDDLEAQIRTNKAPDLAQLVNAIRFQDVPRSLTARFANLLRRMGAIKYAIKILNPIVRGEFTKPTASEIIEYASCLTRFNLEEESINLLSEIGDEPNPEVQFELAAAHISKWNFQTAIPFLKKYIDCEGLSPYRVCVGKLNLAVCHIYTDDLERGQTTLQELLKTTEKSGFDLLSGNALELLGEISLMNRDLKAAEKYFRKSGEKLVSANPRYRLYLEKWLAISKMIKENGSEASLDDLARVRKKMAQIKDWNSIRQIELFRAVVMEDIEAVKNLYYGVSYPEFRKRILSVWGKPIKVDSYHERQIGQGDSGIRKVFDVAIGKDLHMGAQLKPGQTLHRLLQVLVSDFYAPFLTTKIFSLVFKGSLFNPNFSPQQVYMVVKRLNEWFTQNKIPLVVLRGQGGYRLRANEAYVLRIPNDMDLGIRTKLDDFIDNLLRHGLIEKFSKKMVKEKLGLPDRTASRLLTECFASGKLSRQGNGQSITYSLNTRKAVA